MLAQYLENIVSYIAKHDVLVHKHPGVTRPHPVEAKHRVLSQFGSDLQNYHEEHVPHLHPEDEELVRYIKRKLATNSHNRHYWRNQGQLMLSQVRSWQQQTDKFRSGSFSLQLRKFEEGTGFELSELKKHLERAKMYKGHNPYLLQKELALFYAKFKKMLGDNFQDVQ